jgi:intracellular septation protein
MGGVVVSLIASYWLTRHLPIMPVVTAGMVVVFGSLTFVFHDESFIKIKPTIINALMGSVLLGGLVLGRPLLPVVLDSVLHLDEKGWHKLTFRWGVFFLFLAVLNEIVWRQVTTDQWVTFKTFGTMPVTLIFLVSQMPLILRHQITKNDSDQAPDHF